MNLSKLLTFLAIALMPAAFMTGCRPADQPGPVGQNGQDHGHDHDHDHDHSHEHGPHGGHLIGLGEKHEYHLEWDHDDDAQSIVMYILDHDHQDLVPIAADFVTVTFTVDDASRDYEVPAQREEGEETTAKFASDDADLHALMTSEESVGKVTVEIEGTPYEGEIEHHHH